MKPNRSLLGLAMLAVLAGSAAAAENAPVLRNNQITESALIEALGVEPPPPPEGATRGFKPSVSPTPGTATTPGAAARPAAEAAPRKPAAPGRANLLIVFDTASATLTAESKSALDTVAKALQSDALAGLRFRVEGHADARGDADANLRLSQARAEAVVAYLVGHHGILPERLSAHGKGDAEPLNRARVDAPENRRVTIVTHRG